MPVSDRDILVRAFASDEWCATADALLNATGMSTCVMGLASGEALSPAPSCGFCSLGAALSERSAESCFDITLDPHSGAFRVLCHSGLVSLFAPVERDGRTIAYAVLSGFVTNTRERKGLYERTLARGASEEQARRAVKAVPVIPRQRAEPYLRMIAANAQTLVNATASKLAAASRVEELRLFVSAGHQVASTEHLDESTLGAIIEEAVALVGASAGAVLRPHGSDLEVIASCGDWRGSAGDLVPRDTTVAGRALETRKTVVAASGGRRDTASERLGFKPRVMPPGIERRVLEVLEASGHKEPPAETESGDAPVKLAMPLMSGQRVLGVLEARIDRAKPALSKQRLARLERFGAFIAVALDREDERRRIDRAMSGYQHLSELASSLGAQTDTDLVAGIVGDALGRSFIFDMAGLVLTGWGRDRADVVVRGVRSEADVDHVLEIVSGRDLEAEPFAARKLAPLGVTLSQDPPSEDWALAVCELEYGALTVGWLFVARCDRERYNAQDHALLRGIASHAASAFGRAALFRRVRDDYAKTIAALSASIDHQGQVAPSAQAGRVMELALTIGEELGLDFEALEQLRFAGLLHEMGRGGLPEEILLRPIALSPDEMESIRHHPEIGTSIVEQIEFLKSLTPVILHHHEYWDGSGYPQGLKGEKIPLLARVLAVAEAYDSMTSDDSYRPKVPIAQAREDLEALAGVHFDPRCVEALFAVFDRMALAGRSGLLVGSSPSSHEYPV